LLCRVFCENKKLNLEFENSFSEIASLRSVHIDMSVELCDNCKMIMVNYVDLWLVHTQVTSRLRGAKSELRELKAHSILLGDCSSCPLHRSDLKASAVEIKDLKRQIDHSSRYSVLSPPCEMCGSLKGKLFHATKENTELKQEVAYLTVCLEKTKLRQVQPNPHTNWLLDLRDVRTRVGRVLPSLFLAPTTTRRKQSNPPKLTTHPIQRHHSTPREK
jgi:hypothetical protein